MKPLIHKDLKDHLLQGLKDDGYGLDWTTLGTTTGRSGSNASGKKARPLSAYVVAKSEGVFFGAILAQAAEAASIEINFPFSVKLFVEDGAHVKAGTKVLEWTGSAPGILALERPYLNLASYLSGIATRTGALVSLVASEWKKKKYVGKPPRVVSTRKILPHYRDAAISAVIAGGGYPHRVNLAGGALIKENHIKAAGSIRAAIEGVRSVAPHGLKIEIEVTNLSELREALASRAEIIMLDNFSPSDVAKATDLVGGSKEVAEYTPLIECSGGISEETISKYAQPGVDILSIGGLTHSVKALDLSLLVK